MKETKPWLKHIQCPHCHQDIDINLGIDINAVTVGGTKKETQTRYSGEETAILNDAEATGILEAFREAWNAHNIQSPLIHASSVGDAFLKYLKLAVPKRVPSFVIETYVKEFPGHLFFTAAQGVVSVISDGRLRAFFPQLFALGAKIGRLGSNGGGITGRLPADEARFSEWIRTKHGYVVGHGLFFEAMQKRSRGEFVDIVDAQFKERLSREK